MRNFLLSLGPALCFVLAPAITAAQPVGTSTGDVFFTPADAATNPGRGALLYVAPAPGQVGTYTLSTGETFTLGPGSGPIGRDRRPSIINGGGDNSNGGTGTIFLSNGSTIELIGDQGGPSVFIGEEAGSGSFFASSGAILSLVDLGLLDIDGSIGENGVKIEVGRSNGTGLLSFDNATLEMTSTSRVRFGIGQETSTSQGTAIFSNGSVVTMQEIDAPGAVANGADIVVGEAGGAGTLSISDSSFLLSSEGAEARLRAGQSGGDGTLTLENGATMTLEGVRANLRFGDSGGGEGTLNVIGGSSLTVDGSDRSGIFFAGNPGATGTGLFQDSTVTLNAGTKTEIGLADDGGTATLTIDNSTVSLQSAEDTAIFAGVGPGNGTLAVTNNSVLNLGTTDASSSFAQIYAGADFKGPGATGTLTVDGGSTVNIASAHGTRMRVGEEGTTGTATISGAGTSVNLTSGAADFSFLRVGRGAGSSGTLAVEDGAAITLDGARTRFEVGRRGDALGVATVTEGGTIAVGGADGVIVVGDDDPGAGDAARGILTITGAGSKVSASTRVNIGALTGPGTTSGIVTVANGGVLEAPDVNVGAGGVLSGNGTVIGDVALGPGGFLSPGLSPGELVIDGDLVLDGGTLDLEIGGTGLFDVITADRVVAGGAFDMMVSFVGGYVPEVGDTVSFLKAGAFVGDVFGNASLLFENGFDGNLFFDNDGNVSLGVTMSVIPLPAPAFLLLGALGLLGAWGRSRRWAG